MIDISVIEQNEKAIRNASYIGRFISMGQSKTGNKFFQIYCTMGRSKSSQARKLIEENGIIKTIPVSTSDLNIDNTNNHLLMYSVAGNYKDDHIVTNGEQTDTILAYLQENKCFEDAIYAWKHEYDSPIDTPRISAIASFLRDGSVDYRFSISKMFYDDDQNSIVEVYRYNTTIPGFGLFIHTYDRDNLCKSFQGKPYFLKMYDTIEDNSKYYKDLINDNIFVGMFIKAIDMSTGEFEWKIINRGGEEITYGFKK